MQVDIAFVVCHVSTCGCGSCCGRGQRHKANVYRMKAFAIIPDSNNQDIFQPVAELYGVFVEPLPEKGKAWETGFHLKFVMISPSLD